MSAAGGWAKANRTAWLHGYWSFDAMDWCDTMRGHFSISTFPLKVDHLPRQAQDKHLRTLKRTPFCTATANSRPLSSTLLQID
jgi:hypothetical protein